MRTATAAVSRVICPRTDPGLHRAARLGDLVRAGSCLRPVRVRRRWRLRILVRPVEPDDRS
ncbi:hypothetical protein AB0G15_07990 [Streptosporangium sp. NPDC023825]|uniref:hypothetical protein n=1 Tax=Streptosporangium sp. NPDC023825 TaxID=3154909 RepID=UPI00343870F0